MPAATSLTSTLRDPRGSLRRAARRHRRPLAATLAGLAAVLALTTLRGGTAPATTPSGTSTVTGSALPGEVTVPVVLSSSAMAAVLRVGDVIDLVAAATPTAVVARGARVVELSGGGSALGGSASAVVLVALPESDALRVVTSTGDGLTPMIRSR